MKRFYTLTILFALTVLTVSTALLYADVYIKEKINTRAVSDKGGNVPTDDVINEYWFGKKIMARIGKTNSVIIDKTKNRIYFILKDLKLVIESALPFEGSKLRSNELGSLLQNIEFKRAVTDLKESKNIKGKICKKYLEDNWMIENGIRKGDLSRTVWITTSVPFDLSLYTELVNDMCRLTSDKPDFFAELEKQKGFPMYSESTRIKDGVTIITVQEVIEMSNKKAPTGVYTVPAGLNKAETFSIQSLLGLLRD